MRVTVVVLGDLGRSPRTVLQARALASAGHDVDLIGFVEGGWSADHDRIRIWPLPDYQRTSGAPFLTRAGTRGAQLVSALTRLLCTVPSPDVILVQNPPGIPTLLLAWIAARFRRAQLVIDWHNLTSSMLALRLGQSHWLVTLAESYEGWVGRHADGNLFVSTAMQQALGTRWGIDGVVFYDRPARAFRRLTAEEKAVAREALLVGLGETPSRVDAILVTSTSWTADEDFEVLFRALLDLDAALRAHTVGDREQRVVMLITGRGPARASYERRFVDAGLQRVAVHIVWLSIEDYRRALATADIGISLHRSSSGLDLPMKVVDMFGAGLPVVAFDYGPCLRELVRPGIDGLLFSTSEELATLLARLLLDRAGERTELETLRQGVATQTSSSWEQGWEVEVLPLLKRLTARR